MMWPLLLDYTKDECVRMLRELELGAYSNVVSTFRAQGNLTTEKKKLLRELQEFFSISLERHQAEVRRVSNDEKLSTIAHYISGPSNASEWIEEGKRLIPLLPRLVPQTAFYGVANTTAWNQVKKNELMPPPSATQNKRKLMLKEKEEHEAKRAREENQNITVTRKPTPSTPKAKQMGPISSQVVKPTRIINVQPPIKHDTIRTSAPSTPRVILVSSAGGTSALVPMSTVSSCTHTYSRSEQRVVKTIVRGQADTETVKSNVIRTMPSQKVYVVPTSSAGKTSYTTIPVPGNLRGLQLASGSGMILPGSNLNQSGLTIHSYGRNVTSAKPNLIIMPSKSSSSLTSTVKPIVVSSSLSKPSTQQRLVTIRQPTSDARTFKLAESNIGGGSSSGTQSDKLFATKSKASFNLSSGNVIEIQAPGDAIHNLMRKGTLSQEILELVQRAVSQQQGAQVVQQIPPAKASPDQQSQQSGSPRIPESRIESIQAKKEGGGGNA